MKSGNRTTVAALRTGCGRIRDGVDGSDEEQHAYQPNGMLEFQIALEKEETITLMHIAFHQAGILHSIIGRSKMFS